MVATGLRLLARVGEALDAAGVAAEQLSGAGPAQVVSLVPAELVEGLEFAAVVLLEPADLAASGPAGLRLLHVALTRAVTNVTVLHARDLPDALDLVPGSATLAP